MNFKEFFRLCEFATNLNVPLATVLPGNIPFGTTDSGQGPAPSQDPAPTPVHRNDMQLSLPTVTISGKITSVTGPGQQHQGEAEQDGRKNTIQVTIDNSSEGDPQRKATHLLLNWDEFSRKHLIKGGELRVGNMATVVFQRHPSDKSRIPSQIQGITVH